MFTWSDPEKTKESMVILGKNGDLLDLTIDRKDEGGTAARPLPLFLQRHNRAEQFMTGHYPEALKLFHLTRKMRKERPNERSRISRKRARVCRFRTTV